MEGRERALGLVARCVNQMATDKESERAGSPCTPCSLCSPSPPSPSLNLVATPGRNAERARHSAGEGAVFSLSALTVSLSSLDEDIFARRRRQQQQRRHQEGTTKAETGTQAVEEARENSEKKSEGEKSATHEIADRAASPTRSEQELEQHLKQLLHAFVRTQWALFETQTNLHVQLRNCATQLTSSADANTHPTLPLQLIEETRAQTAKVEALREQIEKSGEALRCVREHREATLRQEIATRQAHLDELALRLAEGERAQQLAAQELQQLEQMRSACEEGEPHIEQLRNQLKLAEENVAILSAQSDKLLRSHSEVVKVRLEHASHSATERSQREAAALNLLLGRTEEAEEALFELDITTAANAEAMQGKIDPELEAVQLLAEAQLRQWSDAAFPVVSKRTDLIRHEAALCWGITLEEDVAIRTPRPSVALTSAASTLYTPPSISNAFNADVKIKIEEPELPAVQRTEATAPNAVPCAQSSSVGSPRSLSACAVASLPAMLPSSATATPVRDGVTTPVDSTGNSPLQPPSTGKRRRNAPYTAEDDLALLQYVSENGTAGAQGDTYWSRAVGSNLLQSNDAAKPSRTAHSLRERWRKILRARYEAADGNVAVAVASQHATPGAAASTGKSSGSAIAATRRSSLDGQTPQRQGGSSGRRQQVPKAVANALWRRDCGESFNGSCSVCEQVSLSLSLSLSLSPSPSPSPSLSLSHSLAL